MTTTNTLFNQIVFRLKVPSKCKPKEAEDGVAMVKDNLNGANQETPANEDIIFEAKTRYSQFDLGLLFAKSDRKEVTTLWTLRRPSRPKEMEDEEQL
ncbi:hypothetical protein CPC16_002532 [Podila verticillata]|nr:hypothetical protein CPC16_002532 [Podila verticillata]